MDERAPQTGSTLAAEKAVVNFEDFGSGGELKQPITYDLM
jgi:hypothetical protein